MTTIINADNGSVSGVSGLKYSADSSGVLVLQTNGTTALTIDTSQNVTFAGTVSFATGSFTNLSYTGTLTGGTGVVNLGSGQFYKDASGNVGIGVTPSAWSTSNNTKALQVSTLTSVYQAFSGSNFASNTFYNGSNDVYITTAFAGKFSFDANVGNFAWSSAASGTAGTTATFTERMRIDSSGNLIVGGTTAINSAASRGNITVNGSSSAVISLGVGGVSKGYIYTQGTDIIANADTGAFTVQTSASQPVIFATNASERMRIDSSGNLLVGQTAVGDSNSNSFSFGKNGWCNVNHVNGSGSGTGYIYFGYNGSSLGSITQNGTTAILYNTTSDYRLKSDVKPIQDGLSTISALNPVNFNWADGRNDDGFIAHELQEVIPNCVTGEKDAVNEDGTPKYQQMDNSGVIPFLVKAIQEQQAMIEELKAEVAALKAK